MLLVCICGGGMLYGQGYQTFDFKGADGRCIVCGSTDYQMNHNFANKSKFVI